MLECYAKIGGELTSVLVYFVSICQIETKNQVTKAPEN
jgi:hypothetical protein